MPGYDRPPYNFTGRGMRPSAPPVDQQLPIAFSPPPYLLDHPRSNTMQPSVVYVDKKGSSWCECLGRIPVLSMIAFGLVLSGVGLVVYGSESALNTTLEFLEIEWEGYQQVDTTLYVMCILGVLYFLLIFLFTMCSGVNRDIFCNRAFVRCMGLFALCIMIVTCLGVIVVLYGVNCITGAAALTVLTVQLACVNLGVNNNFNATEMCVRAVDTLNQVDLYTLTQHLQLPSFNRTIMLTDKWEEILNSTDLEQMNFQPGDPEQVIPMSVCYNLSDTCEQMMKFTTQVDLVAMGVLVVFIGSIVSLISLSANWAHLRDHGKNKKESKEDFFTMSTMN